MLQMATVDFQGFPATIGKSVRHERDMVIEKKEGKQWSARMIKGDTILEIQGKIAAQEFVLKATLQMLHQLAPEAGIQSAMKQIVSNSVRRANVEGTEPDQVKAEMVGYVETYALQIIDAGFGASPAKPVQ
jgi:hypothetical protein